MPDALVLNSALTSLRDTMQLPDVRIVPLTAGLSRIELPTEEVLDQVRSLPGVVAGRMSVSIEGQPMDVHGAGFPMPAGFELRSRLLSDAATPTDGGDGVLIGLVDSGIYPNSWLDGGYLSAPDDFERAFPQGEPDKPLPLEIGHGTFAAGLILQQAPAAGVWVERVLDGSGLAESSRVAEAALLLARRGVHVLNLSLGAFADDPNAKAVMEQLITDLKQVNPNLVIVAAAGNLAHDHAPGDFWPAALPDVLAVGAVESAPAAPGTTTPLASWSNRGSWLDLAAPGKDLLSTYLDRPITPPGQTEPVAYEGWAIWSGTSFATAVVSGAIARLMSDGSTSAAEAVGKLRAGTALNAGWTTAEADGVPAVPVVSLRTDFLQTQVRGPALDSSMLRRRSGPNGSGG